MFAKVHPAEDVKSGNTGSCHDLVRYLEKETGEGQRFFSHTEQDISPERVIMDIDGNKKALGANDAKFFMLSLNPSQSEQMHLIGRKVDDFKELTPVQKISYTCMDEYGSGTTHANYDVMYAMAKGQTKDMNNGIVKFNFKHILSQVVFKAKTQYDNMQVDIDVIKIHNFKFAGAFTLPAAADGTGSWSSSDLAFPHAFTVVKNANITVNSNTEATDITTNTPMLNIPQELTAWKVSETATKSKLEADNAKQCYLEIACKIRQSGAYLLGSASEYKTIYVPFGDTWEQGKRHIYTLIFGGGYDDQGEAVLNPIQFDAETTGWVDADKDVNVQP